MDAKIVNLQTLFEPEVSYRIPQFQRPYVWGEDAQWKPLWDDVQSVVVRLLNRKPGDKIRPHFMGAIVLQHQTSKTGEVTKRLVVDGQQRLTTLQLLIKATEQEFQSQDDTVRTDRLRRLIINQKSYWGDDLDNETKIRQSSHRDQRAFQAAINSHNSNHQSQPWAISQAYRYLQIPVGDWLNSKFENRNARADALEEVLTKYLEIAVIDLDEDEEPHIVFETLNARGEPLKQSDLIKNTVMYEANVIDDAQKALELWGRFENEWWREDTGETGLRRSHIDRFLNYWMLMRTPKEITVDRVASEFRNYIDRRKKQDRKSSTEVIEVVAEDIREAGGIYQKLEKIEFPEIEDLLNRIKIMDLGVGTLPLLWLYTSDVSPEKRLRSARALESYLVRRILCGLPSHGLTKFFVSLIAKLNRDGLADADNIIIRYLMSPPTDSSQVWPNDRMLYERLTTEPMRGAVPRKKMVFVAIEVSLRSDKSESLGNTDKLTVEHIMPQKWEKNWPLPPDKEEGEATTDRNEVVKSIGNLTLTTAKLNAKLSNNPWSEKRKTLGNHSSLFLNKLLLNDAPDIWDEATIQERNQYLAELVTRIWPYADRLTVTSR